MLGKNCFFHTVTVLTQFPLHACKFPFVSCGLHQTLNSGLNTAEFATIVLGLKSGIITSALHEWSLHPQNYILPRLFSQSPKNKNSMDSLQLNQLNSRKYYTEITSACIFRVAVRQQWRHGDLWWVSLCFWRWLCPHRLQQSRISSSS
jgi:hypothetical protein